MASGSSLILKSNVGAANTGEGTMNIFGDISVTNIEGIPLDDFPMPGCIDTFYGRDEEIDQLSSLYFKKSKNKVVICGLPGFGKTELSKHFAKHCLDNNKIKKVLWIEGQKKEVKTSYPKLQKIYEAYNDNCLVIFDNGASWKDIFDYKPPEKDNFFMLITSQEKEWGPDVTSVRLKPLRPQFSLDILKSILGNYYKKENNRWYKQLARIVDHVPLGLQIIGGYVRREINIFGPEFNLEKYFVSIQKSQEEFIKKRIPQCNPNTYEYSIYGAMQVSLNKIKEEEDSKVRELALTALFVCCYLDPLKISDKDLLKISNRNEIVPQSSYTNTQMKRSLALLVNFSFINNDHDIKIHRLVQRFLRYHLIDSGQGKYYAACMNYGLHDKDFYTHLMSVFSYADENIDTVYKIYKKEKKNNVELTFNLRKHNTDANTSRASSFSFMNIGYKNKRSTVGDILSWLIECGCIKSLKKIFESSPTRVNEYILKYNLLYTSVEYNQINISKLLLNYANKNEIKKLKILFTAIDNGIIEMISILIAHGANLQLENDEGDPPLFAFIKKYVSAHINWRQILTLFKFDKTLLNSKKETLLHVAAVGRHIDLIEILILDYNLQVNQQDAQERTSLHALVYNISSTDINIMNIHKITSILEKFIKHDALLNIKDSEGKTVVYLLIYYALKYKELEILTWLLLYEKKLDIQKIKPVLIRFTEPDASLDFKDAGDETTDYMLLNYAVDNNEPKFLNWLLQHGDFVSDTKNTILCNAAIKGNKEIIKSLILHGASLNIKYFNFNGETTGHWLLKQAIEKSEFLFFVWLLQHGAHMGLPTWYLKMYLFILAENRHESENLDWKDILTLFKYDKTLLSNNYKETLLHAAAAGRHINLIEILILNYNLQVNQKDARERTPLHALVYNMSSTDIDTFNTQKITLILEKFIEHSALVNIKDSDGKTVVYLILHYAVKYNEFHILERLVIYEGKLEIQYIKSVLKRFVELNFKYLNDNTVEYVLLSYATENNEFKFLHWLLEAGADIKLTNTSILHNALDKNKIEIITILIAHGASLNYRYSNSETVKKRWLLIKSGTLYDHMLLKTQYDQQYWCRKFNRSKGRIYRDS